MSFAIIVNIAIIILIRVNPTWHFDNQMVSLRYINCILAMAEMIPKNNVTGNNVTYCQRLSAGKTDRKG